MKSHFIVTIAIAASILSGCMGLAADMPITGRYHLIAVDTDNDMTVSYRLEDGNYVGVVPETVFAVGHNDDYIIAKLHPDNNRKITMYYVVPVYKTYTLWPEKGVIGPLSETRFTATTKELGIQQLTFTKTIDKLK